MNNRWKMFLGTKINLFVITLLQFHSAVTHAHTFRMTNDTRTSLIEEPASTVNSKKLTNIKTASADNANANVSKLPASNTDAVKTETAATTNSNNTAAKVDTSTVASTDDSVMADTPVEDTSKDPLEPFNRAMFTFNDKIDKYLLKPVATFYNKIMPKPLNQGVHNFFVNIGTVTVIANDVLQLHFHQAANDTWRLGVNTTVGIGGLFDVATRIKLPAYRNDFGMTMARWGYKNSTYLVLPFFGPNTIRDGISIPVDYYAFSVYPYIQPESTRYEIYGLGIIDKRAQLLKYEEVVDEAAVDRYVFVRDAYIQHRKSQIEQNDHRSYSDLKDTGTAEVTVTASGTGLPATTNNATESDVVPDPAPDAKIAANKLSPSIKKAIAAMIATNVQDPGRKLSKLSKR